MGSGCFNKWPLEKWITSFLMMFAGLAGVAGNYVKIAKFLMRYTVWVIIDLQERHRFYL